MNQVNIFTQVLATIFLPTGIYAFKRIKKLKMGGVSYGLSFLAGVLSGFLAYFSLTSIAFGMATLSFLIPMIFMYKYCVEYNSRISIIKK